MTVEFQSFSSRGVCESRRRLHTPSAFARRSLFYVQEVGTLKSIKSHLCRRDGLDSFLFILVPSLFPYKQRKRAVGIDVDTF